MSASNIISVAILANTETPLVGASRTRKAITFTFQQTTALFIRTDAIGNVAGGLVVSASGGPLILTREMHGDIINNAWLGFSAAAGVVGVIETID